MPSMNGIEFSDFLFLSFNNCLKTSFHVTSFQIEFDGYLSDEDKYQFLAYFDNRLSEILMVDLYPETLGTIPKFVHITELPFSIRINHTDGATNASCAI